jgi:cell division septation protein DedD
MPERSEGEFEFTLGNRQLFSVLFIVVVLLGLFFAMGFLAGRSTAPEPVKTVAKADQGPLRVDSGPAAPVTQTEAAKPVETPTELPAEAAKPEPAKPEPAKPEPVKAEPPKAVEQKPVVPAKAGGVVDAPPAGRYLQVAATVLNDAQTLRLQLAERRLAAIIAPSSKPEYVRVLVGPLADNDAITAAREELKKIGIASPYLVSYK